MPKGVPTTRAIRNWEAEKLSASNAAAMRGRLSGARVMSDDTLELPSNEAPLTSADGYLMDLLYNSPVGGPSDEELKRRQDHQNQTHKLRKANATAATSATTLEDSDDDEEFQRSLKTLSPAMQKYVNDCRSHLKQLDKECQENKDVPFERILTDRKVRNDFKDPTDADIEQATAEFRRLSLEPGGVERGWRSFRSKVNRAYRSKHKTDIRPLDEEWVYFAWEMSRAKAASELPKSLNHINTVARTCLASTPLPPKPICDYIHNYGKHNNKPTHQKAPPVPLFNSTSSLHDRSCLITPPSSVSTPLRCCASTPRELLAPCATPAATPSLSALTTRPAFQAPTPPNSASTAPAIITTPKLQPVTTITTPKVAPVTTVTTSKVAPVTTPKVAPVTTPKVAPVTTPKVAPATTPKVAPAAASITAITGAQECKTPQGTPKSISRPFFGLGLVEPNIKPQKAPKPQPKPRPKPQPKHTNPYNEATLAPPSPGKAGSIHQLRNKLMNPFVFD